MKSIFIPDKLWAKTASGNNFSTDTDYNSVVRHGIDAAHIGLELYKKDSYASIALRDIPTEFIASLISMHDIGKINPVFQYQSLPQVARLSDDNILVQDISLEDYGIIGRDKKEVFAHQIISFIHVLDKIGYSNPIMKSNVFLHSLGFHHGRKAEPENIASSYRILYNMEVEEPRWKSWRDDAMSYLCSVFGCHDFMNMMTSLNNPKAYNLDRILIYLIGLIVKSDRLSSDARNFPLLQDLSLEEYIDHSKERSLEVVANRSFFNFPSGRQTFRESFDFSPRSAQGYVDFMDLSQPFLVILEAETGSGKTEFAFAVDAKSQFNHTTNGFLFCLPTTATTTAMHHRSSKMDKIFEGSPVNLIHSLSRFEDYAYPDAWLRSSKQGLAAPCSVSTVDQLLLSFVGNRHSLFRASCLANKHIIIDEMHAYDTYMSDIIYSALMWAGSTLDASFTILSATLPPSTKKKIIESYIGKELDRELSYSYPCLTIAHKNGDCVEIPLPKVSRTPVSVSVSEVKKTDNHKDVRKFVLPKNILSKVHKVASTGGCVAIICNDKRKVDNVTEQVRKKSGGQYRVIKIHSHMQRRDRQKREEEILSIVGIEGTREPCVIVSSQILEQSLDIDFDFMVSYLCPIDLLIQRIGRLWRHDILERPVSSPQIAILVEPPDVDRLIYGEYLLDATKLVLKGLRKIEIPEDIPSLIRRVYEDDHTDLSWQRTKMDKDIARKETAAQFATFGMPSGNGSGLLVSSVVSQEPSGLSDEQVEGESIYPSRLDCRSISTIILLRGKDDSLITKVSQDIRLSEEDIRELMLHSVPITTQYLEDTEYDGGVCGGFPMRPLAFRHIENYALKYLQCVVLGADGFGDMLTDRGFYSIILDDDSCISIEKKGK